MRKRSHEILTLAAALAVLAGCREPETGPIEVTAIGAPPQIVNPNLRPLAPASAFALEAAAQGLVRFDAAGEIEPALAQSWIVSDDGLRYTFRIRRTRWADGERVTAEQVAARLRAAASRASRNPLKPALGAVDDVVAMTDEVLEISLTGPRPNLLQLLAQPEMAILMDGLGTGPYRLRPGERGAARLDGPRPEEDEAAEPELPDLVLRGAPAAVAVARFADGAAELVIGGSVGDLPFARVAGLPGNRLVFDPAQGLFGFAFASAEGPLAEAAVRMALSMAIDREALVAALSVPGLQARLRLHPAIANELAAAPAPDWAAAPMPMRREFAARAIAELDSAPRLRIALPDAPGYRIVFAHLRRDWRLIGVEAERVAPDAEADLVLVDAVAPAMLASWYLRRFTCDASPVCDEAADAALAAARAAPSAAERRARLAEASRLLTGQAPFIPIATPVRWSLVAPRLTGFRANAFARHPAGTLIAQE